MQIVHDAIDDDRLDRDGDGNALALSRQTPRAFDVLRSEVELDATDDDAPRHRSRRGRSCSACSASNCSVRRSASIDDHEAFFREAVTVMGARIGLR